MMTLRQIAALALGLLVATAIAAGIVLGTHPRPAPAGVLGPAPSLPTAPGAPGPTPAPASSPTGPAPTPPPQP